MATTIVCSGDITVDVTGAPQCSSGWESVEHTPSQPFDPADLDPSLIVGAVTAGFFILVPIWAAAFGFRSLLKSIKRYA
jgi:hypothetical protein